VVAAAALYVGGAPPTALRLGVAMVALQASIGIVNDLVDAPRDVGRVPPKPIPAGLVGRRQALLMASLAAGLGIGLSMASGPPLVVIAIVVLAIGYGYDFVLKGTVWSWVPFAVGIPLLPVFGWVGVTGGLPQGSGVVVVAAMVAGAGLAIANARADLEVDRASGTASVATALGLDRSWWLANGLFLGVAVVAGALLIGPGAFVGAALAALLLAGVGVGLLVIGAVLGRKGSPRRRERAWEAQAIGLAVLAVPYLAAQPGLPG
jgi:4-hydroxybenzoate polyprenyltransferase